MDVKDHTVSYVSDLKEYGKKCDGHPFIGECYYVIIEAADGRRWKHREQLDGAWVDHNEFGEAHFMDCRQEAVGICERLVARIRRAGQINLDHWTEVRPAYGSKVYVDEDWTYQDMIEERMAG